MQVYFAINIVRGRASTHASTCTHITSVTSGDRGTGYAVTRTVAAVVAAAAIVPAIVSASKHVILTINKRTIAVAGIFQRVLLGK